MPFCRFCRALSFVFSVSVLSNISHIFNFTAKNGSGLSNFYSNLYFWERNGNVFLLFYIDNGCVSLE